MLNLLPWNHWRWEIKEHSNPRNIKRRTQCKWYDVCINYITRWQKNNNKIVLLVSHLPTILKFEEKILITTEWKKTQLQHVKLLTHVLQGNHWDSSDIVTIGQEAHSESGGDC